MGRIGDRAPQVGDERRVDRVRARPVEDDDGDPAVANLGADVPRRSQAVLRLSRSGAKASS